MQHKQKTFTTKRIFIFLAVSILTLTGWLMFGTIPAPQQTIEKELDAKTLLEQKQ